MKFIFSNTLLTWSLMSRAFGDMMDHKPDVYVGFFFKYLKIDKIDIKST